MALADERLLLEEMSWFRGEGWVKSWQREAAKFQTSKARTLWRGMMSKQEREARVKRFEVEGKMTTFLEVKLSWREDIV